MGRKSTAKRRDRYRQYVNGHKPKHGRDYLRVMKWANRSGYAELMGYGNRRLGTGGRLLASMLSIPKGVIAIHRDVFVSRSRIVLAGRLNRLAYGKHAKGLNHKEHDGRLRPVVECFPHLHRKMIKTMPRGQAFARIVKLENDAND